MNSIYNVVLVSFGFFLFVHSAQANTHYYQISQNTSPYQQSQKESDWSDKQASKSNQKNNNKNQQDPWKNHHHAEKLADYSHVAKHDEGNKFPDYRYTKHEASQHSDQQAVPIPAALWLFATFLSGLMFYNHRQRS